VTFYFLKYILVKFSRGLKFHAIKQYLFFMGDFSHYKNLQKKPGKDFWSAGKTDILASKITHQHLNLIAIMFTILLGQLGFLLN